MKTTLAYSYKTNAPPHQPRMACQTLVLITLIGAGWIMALCPAATSTAEAPPPPNVPAAISPAAISPAAISPAATSPAAISPAATSPAAISPAATSPAASEKGVQILTRGPVHEAFAGVVTFNPQPGVVVPKVPPTAIEEIPPGERPVGNNVTWIPGYWTWDDERTDFVWVSGTWRALPPGRQWMPGYWGQTTAGYQWTSGYWADAAAKETTYLPAPPATVEDGPNVAAPSVDYRWTPGSWIWNENRYAWGPGYWARGRVDWDWSPSHYVWTPRGYVYVGGYWDYPVSRRGSLFAPVYFDSGVYSQAGFAYAPSIAIDLAVFAEVLFLRPHYNHYYFGDYYDNSYQKNGYFSAYAYQNNLNGYDPIYSYQRWQNRQNQGWNGQMAATYQYRQNNLSARPPRTWAAQQAIASTSEFKQNRMLVAAPLSTMASSNNSGVRYQAVTKSEKQALSQRGQQVALASDQRRTAETKGATLASLKPGELITPSKVTHASSPIVAKTTNQLGKGNAPPAAQRSPKPQAVVQPTTAAGARLPKTGATNPLPEPRKATVEPSDKQVTPQPRKATVVPSNKQVTPQPRKATVVPSNKQVTPQPRKATEVPSNKQVTPQPRKATVVPSNKQVTPQPRK
ncbi:MAG: hypothetical protein WCP35_19675, partial [Verrucomicrobiota bacterium]